MNAHCADSAEHVTQVKVKKRWDDIKRMVEVSI